MVLKIKILTHKQNKITNQTTMMNYKAVEQQEEMKPTRIVQHRPKALLRRLKIKT